MNGLRSTIGQLAALHPAVIENDFSSLQTIPALLEDAKPSVMGTTSSGNGKERERGERLQEDGASADAEGRRRVAELLCVDPSLAMAELAERLVSQLMLVLSMGLHDGVDVWSVLETLSLIPEKLSAGSVVLVGGSSSPSPSPSASPSVQHSPQGTASGVVVSKGTVVAAGAVAASGGVVTGTAVRPAALTSSSSSGALARGSVLQASAAPAPATSKEVLQQRLCKRLGFAPQLVRTVNTGYPTAPSPVRARVFLRLALNYGCLSSALELVARHNRREIAFLYKNPELNLFFHYKPPRVTSFTAPAQNRGEPWMCGTDGGGYVVSHGDLWEQFIAAVSPVGGVPLSDIEAGATKGFSLLQFQLTLFVKGLDDDVADYAQPPTLPDFLLSFDTPAAAATEAPSAAASTSTAAQEARTPVVRGVVVPTEAHPRPANTAVTPRQPSPPPARSTSPTPALRQAYQRTLSSLSFSSPVFQFTGAAFPSASPPPVNSGGGGAASGGGSDAVATFFGLSETPAPATPPPLPPLGAVVKCFYHVLGEYLYGLTRTPPQAVRSVRNHILATWWRRQRKAEAPRPLVVKVLPVHASSVSGSSTAEGTKGHTHGGHDGASSRAHRYSHRHRTSSEASARKKKETESQSRAREGGACTTASDDATATNRALDAEDETLKAAATRRRRRKKDQQRRSHSVSAASPHMAAGREVSPEAAVAAFDSVKGGQWAAAVVERLRSSLMSAGSSGHTTPVPTPPPALPTTAAEPKERASMIAHDGLSRAAEGTANAPAGPAPLGHNGSRPTMTQPPLLAQLAARKAQQQQQLQQQQQQDALRATPLDSDAAQGSPQWLHDTKAPPLVRTLKAMRRASGLGSPTFTGDTTRQNREVATVTDGAAPLQVGRAPSTEKGTGAPDEGSVERSQAALAPDTHTEAVMAAEDVKGILGKPESTDPKGEGSGSTGAVPASLADKVDSLLDELEELLKAYEEC